MGAQQPTGIKQAIQSLLPDAPRVVDGTVVQEAPLQVALANDAKMVLGENALIVSQHLTDHAATADIPELGLSGAQLLVKGALKRGEGVCLLEFNSGKKYFILDRKG